MTITIERRRMVHDPLSQERSLTLSEVIRTAQAAGPMPKRRSRVGIANVAQPVPLPTAHSVRRQAVAGRRKAARENIAVRVGNAASNPDLEHLTFDPESIRGVRVVSKAQLPKISFTILDDTKTVRADFMFNHLGIGTHSVEFYTRTTKHSSQWTLVARYGTFENPELMTGPLYRGVNYAIPPAMVDYLRELAIEFAKNKIERMASKLG